MWKLKTSVITVNAVILNRWKSDFSSLHNVDIDRYENDADYIALLNLKNDLEAQQNRPAYKYNTFFKWCIIF